MSALDNKAVRGYIHKLVGDEGMTVVEKMIEKVPDQEVTDEQVAELSGINLNLVRKTLYILYENHLAMYRRETRQRQRLADIPVEAGPGKLSAHAQERGPEADQRSWSGGWISRATSSSSARKSHLTASSSTMPVETNFICPVDESPLMHYDNTRGKSRRCGTASDELKKMIHDAVSYEARRSPSPVEKIRRQRA